MAAKGIIKFKNRSSIEIPLPNSLKNTTGSNFDRQNFYFKPIKVGNEKIVMRYEQNNSLFKGDLK